MCSTPQKHPAATVAFAEPSGALTEAAPSGLRPNRVEVLKGRKRRDMKVGIEAAMRRIRTVVSTVRGVRDSRLTIGCPLICLETV